MRLRSLFIIMSLGVAFVALAACQGPPPTQYVIITATNTLGPQVITATLEPAQATLLAQVAQTLTATASSPGQTVQDDPTPTATATEEATRRAPRTPQSSATVDPFPTPTIAQIQVAEQLFEKGRMFWLEPIDQIWVMAETQEGTGIWTVYSDTFEEGDVEFDPRIVPPTGLLQPIRGFGQLWRDNDEIEAALGWAVEPELGHVSSYEYRPAGEVVDGEYVSEPGYHILSSIYGEVFRFNEINGTWQTIRDTSSQPTP